MFFLLDYCISRFMQVSLVLKFVRQEVNVYEQNVNLLKACSFESRYKR